MNLIGHFEDLDFSDNFALILETIKHLQDMTNRPVKCSKQVGLLGQRLK